MNVHNSSTWVYWDSPYLCSWDDSSIKIE